MDGGKIDYETFSKMVDTFLETGFNYIDTAHGYQAFLRAPASVVRRGLFRLLSDARARQEQL
jgi:predicted aldo/keto reductase-like oxidoreductase